jgi:hypothetical protein
MEMPDETILSNRLPRVERKAMRPKRLIKPAKVSATVQLTNEISRHRVSASADRYNLLRSDRRLSRSKHISQFCRSEFWVALYEGHTMRRFEVCQVRAREVEQLALIGPRALLQNNKGVRRVAPIR